MLTIESWNTFLYYIYAKYWSPINKFSFSLEKVKDPWFWADGSIGKGTVFVCPWIPMALDRTTRLLAESPMYNVLDKSVKVTPKFKQAKLNFLQAKDFMVSAFV